jgi:hypothetical protein
VRGTFSIARASIRPRASCSSSAASGLGERNEIRIDSGGSWRTSASLGGCTFSTTRAPVSAASALGASMAPALSYSLSAMWAALPAPCST